ncbi:MAG: NAD(P)-binding domain-containing protein, partial [Janthinobacterium lividum]
EVVVDHVVAGTGYKVDVERLAFLDNTIRARITQEQNTPVLTRNFESSFPGLYFVGVSAANSFGPLLRFAWGARFTARRLAAHLA